MRIDLKKKNTTNILKISLHYVISGYYLKNYTLRKIRTTIIGFLDY